jgi:hypothetical protein
VSYTKPEVVKLSDAVEAIQGGASKTSIYAETQQLHNATPAAYEADE